MADVDVEAIPIITEKEEEEEAGICESKIYRTIRQI